jgi:hypothetical protein
MPGLLGAESRLAKSHDEGDKTIYHLEIRFTDLLGRSRRHTFPVSLPSDIDIHNRVSYTAISDVMVLPGVLSAKKPGCLVVATSQGFVEVSDRTEQPVNPGEFVLLLERMDLQDEKKMKLIALRPDCGIEHDALRLQSVNADIVDSADNLIFRLAADPIRAKVCEAERVG